jgi:hypothetical protein
MLTRSHSSDFDIPIASQNADEKKAAVMRPFSDPKKLDQALHQAQSSLAATTIGHKADTGKAQDQHRPG